MLILVHSPWLPGNVVQTVLIKLTMVGLLPDRPHRFNIVPVKILVAFLTELVEITKNLYGTAKCAEEPQQSGDREQSWRYHTN